MGNLYLIDEPFGGNGLELAAGDVDAVVVLCDGDQRAAPHIPGEEKKDTKQDEDNEEIACAVPDRERSICGERTYL